MEKFTIGEYYIVPCIEIGDVTIPVLGNSHWDDPSLCLKPIPEHFHEDARFTDYPDNSRVWASAGRKLVSKAMKCIRTNTATSVSPYYPFLIEKLHRICEKATLKKPICPHQQMPIDACGTCPAHGLIWDLTCGKLKYKLPFSLVSSNGESGEIKNGKCDIAIKNTFDGILYLHDADNNRYPNSYLEVDFKETKPPFGLSIECPN